jgi:hypothetical protein
MRNLLPAEYEQGQEVLQEQLVRANEEAEHLRGLVQVAASGQERLAVLEAELVAVREDLRNTTADRDGKFLCSLLM